ncbi:glutaredoxin family protein [Thalassotalea euphylliae]|uniref:Glutaredoxin family protein n=1 Tax=Thalassotalea euphylliae TaxID=1655234 RepID=A0A3E0TY18_9GAMM|nr:glutaredoxin family protein [Thalassotalea euphylliae]REL29536.1 glutaredoxin family protein [Thalassotalea euphylliae]
MKIEHGFILYGSQGCHLCEDALALCQQLTMPVMLTIVDIVDEEDLVEAYGQHIPVMQRDIDGKELLWPFDLEQLNQFVADGLALEN